MRSLPGSPQRSHQLLAALICMVAASSPQYVWTLFTPALHRDLGVSLPKLQVTFSLVIVVQTLFSPIQGWIGRHVKPSLLIGAGSLITGLSWMTAGQARTLAELYLTYGVLGGIGTGIVYVGVVSLLMGWFPERRGFAAGVAAAGYGMGAMITTFPVAHVVQQDGYRTALTVFGAIIGIVGLGAACFLRRPPDGCETATLSLPASHVLKTPVFWLMFFMMATMATSGLMVTSQLAQIAADHGVAHLTILGLAALPLAMTLDRIANGLTRPLFGLVSDHIGREETMAIAFGAEAIALIAWISLAHDPVWFVLLSGVVFLGWGEIFSLFPATLTETFGTQDASRNYGLLYLSQGLGAVFGGPLAAWLHQSSGSWTPVFAIAVGGDVLTAVLAITALRPLRRAYRARRP
ncbi:oxalate/formate MFS antiporter [Tanticharoenia sakaeratensis]|nr:oxalate/formate MFS antiporter [Tanticharoenia sakaeratensis]